MPHESNPQMVPIPPMIYQIKIEGHLNCNWADWFEGLTVTVEEDSNTLLTGPVIDQAALYGLLRKVRDVGMPLISVTRVEPIQNSEQEKNDFNQ